MRNGTISISKRSAAQAKALREVRMPCAPIYRLPLDVLEIRLTLEIERLAFERLRRLLHGEVH